MDSNLPTLFNMIDPDDENGLYKKEVKENKNKDNINNIKEEEKKTESQEKKEEEINNIKKEEKIKEKEKIEEVKEIKKEKMSYNENDDDDIEKEKNQKKNRIKNLIKELNKIYSLGNDFYKKNSYEEAISKYNEGYKIINEELLEVNRNRMMGFNQEIQDFISISKKLMSNLSLAYSQLGKFKESIELDKKIISIDPVYDKSYARLFKSYLKLNQKAEAVFFGDILIKNFSEEIRKNYKDLIPKIEKEKQNLEIEYLMEKERQRKENLKNILKITMPIFVLFVSYIYFKFFKKK
jgi:tetratricopeptide (TPR) repeat protein